MAHAINRLALAASLAVALAGCATTAAMRSGQKAEQLQEYDQAIIEYTKVLRARPDDREARRSLDRAKLRSSLDHYSRGRRLSSGGKLDEALDELQLASELNPGSQDVTDALASVRTQLRTKVAVAREGKTELETLIERTRNLPPPGLDLPANVTMPASLVFRDAGIREVYLTIARFGNLSLGFYPAFRDAPLSVDLRNTTL